jgi:AcrR family transcriptional regulator
MGRHPQPERRSALLDACTRHVLDCGLDGLSINTLAAAAGTSARMLIYHFGTKDQLMSEVLQQARQEQQALFAGLLQHRPGVPYALLLRQAWPQLTSAAAMPYHRLFRQLFDLPPASSPWKDFPLHATEEWVAMVAQGLQADGYRDPRAMATLVVAAVRGLLLDLDVTSDQTRVDDAVNALIELVRQARPGRVARRPSEQAMPTTVRGRGPKSG